MFKTNYEFHKDKIAHLLFDYEKSRQQFPQHWPIWEEDNFNKEPWLAQAEAVIGYVTRYIEG